MNKKIACFVVPFFGKLPNTFPLFLRTCSYNPDYTWLIITDDKTEYLYPSNVHVEYSTFNQFVSRVQSCFEFPITLKRPYKICDFRAAFGEIFADELVDYVFWGHCDIDQYFGNIGHFITDDIIKNYDKILCLGHFTLFRNVKKINSMYKTLDKSRNEGYKNALTSVGHWIFDEWPEDGHTSINRIMKQENIKTYYCNDCFCDLKPFCSRFQRYIFDENIETWSLEPIRNLVFYWKDGNLFSCNKTGGNINRQEILYVHIRQRNLNIKKYDFEKACFIIAPNYITSADVFTESDIIQKLNIANMRASIHPDEIGRKLHLLNNFFVAALRKIKIIK